jgi:hypothetical protein
LLFEEGGKGDVGRGGAGTTITGRGFGVSTGLCGSVLTQADSIATPHMTSVARAKWLTVFNINMKMPDPFTTMPASVLPSVWEPTHSRFAMNDSQMTARRFTNAIVLSLDLSDQP